MIAPGTTKLASATDISVTTAQTSTGWTVQAELTGADGLKHAVTATFDQQPSMEDVSNTVANLINHEVRAQLGLEPGGPDRCTCDPVVPSDGQHNDSCPTRLN